MSRTRVIIIGSGVFGIAAARTYLKLDPSVKLTILEADSSLGGTWSKDRAYPTLTTQQPLGGYEYPDARITSEAPPKGTDASTNYIPTHVLYDYLEKFAKQEGVLDKIIFNTRVVKVEKIGTVEDPRGWEIYIQNGRQDGIPDYTCDKLIVATGQTSEENIPKHLEEGSSSLPIVHSKYMGKYYDKIAADSVSRVTVYGGGKSALDAVYMCAKIGKKVDWVIRPDEVGGGLCCFAPAKLPGFRSGKEGDDPSYSRYATTYHPSLLTTDNSWYKLYHSGANILGYWYNGLYWQFWSRVLFFMTGLYASENGTKLKPVIKPEDSPYWWVNKNQGVITQPEIVEWIRKGENITIHRATITSILSDTLTLTPESTSTDKPLQLQSDMVILCTGFRSFFSSLFSPELSASLGLPTAVASIPRHISEKWDPLTQAAEEKISRTFPRLANPPIPVATRKYSPARLYRYTIPTEYIRHNDRTLAIVGTASLRDMMTYSQLNSLWAVAWLMGKLKNPLEHQTMENIEMQVAEQSIWSVRRYLNAGLAEPYCLIYETIPVFDMLMKDLGLNPYRKNGWYSEVFGSYRPCDYKGIIEEWMSKEGLSGDGRPVVY